MPVIKAAVITRRGTIRTVKREPTLPVRFRCTHQARQNCCHYIEATLFGLPVMKVNECYVKGKERMVMPWASTRTIPSWTRQATLI